MEKITIISRKDLLELENENVARNKTDVLVKMTIGSVSVSEFKEIKEKILREDKGEHILKFSLGEDFVLVENMGKNKKDEEKNENKQTLKDEILMKDRKEIIRHYL